MNVYIIESNGYFKVGLANNVANRLKGLQTSNPHTLKVRKSVRFKNRKQAKVVEAAMHEKFKGQRRRGEWFDADIQLLCAGLDDLASIYLELDRNPQRLSELPSKWRRYSGHKDRVKTLNLIRKSTDNMVVLDKHNVVCLMTGGVGLNRAARKFLGVPRHEGKGWKKALYGKAVDRLEFLRHCDTHLLVTE